MDHPYRVLKSAALRGAVALLVGGFAAVPAAGQTVTTGTIVGTAAARPAGPPVARAFVTLSHRASGWTSRVTTDATGAFRARGLPPGLYDARVERLGYRPLVVVGVMVSPDVTAALHLELTPAEPPVTQVDTTVFVEGAVSAALARGAWDPGHEIADLADPLGRVASLTGLASLSSGGLASAGLPDRFGSIGLDGIPRVVASHPGADRPSLADLSLPLTGLDHAELTPGSDVVWPGFGGSLLSAMSARAPRTSIVRGGADGGTGSLRGHLLAGGPLVRDTAWAVIGVDARRIEPQFAAPWPADSLAPLVATFAHDSLGTDLSAYRGDVKERTDVITGFARFDWQMTGGQRLSLHAAASDLTSRDIDLGTGRPLGLGGSLEARDVLASAIFASRLTSQLDFQASLAIDRTSRDYAAGPLPGTALVADGLWAGADPALPGSFERDETRASAEFRGQFGTHVLKLGAVGSWMNHDIAYDPWRAGAYWFGSVADFQARRGAFVQSVGGTTAASFSSNTVAVTGEDAWSPIGGLNVLFGLRVEREQWPSSGIAANAAWAGLTGLTNAAIPKFTTRANPRFAFAWAAGPQNQWLLRGDAGLYSESADPAVLAEAMSHTGSASVRRGLGNLGTWPAAPDSIAAPVMGPVLTLLNPGMEPPRTGRVTVGMARTVFAGATIQVTGTYRHTDYLVRRSDLNLSATSVTTDQYGRALYGSLQQLGSMVAATPGSNRRFPSFDRVWSLDPSGYSDYSAASVALERVVERGLSLFASYSYSRTTDNVPGLAGSVPDAQLSPFPGGASDWRDGRSDLDIPHRLAVGAELALGSVKIAGLLRYRSGAPFTPGFRDGVDANGDGAFGNDPAFVSDTVKGASAVIGQWSCLQSQVGGFAARNSCRGPAVTSFDARITVRMFRVAGEPVEAVVDGINLLTSDVGVIDRALYLVDPARATTTTGNIVNVPLVANPNFGKLLYRRSPQSSLRAGVRFDF